MIKFFKIKKFEHYFKIQNSKFPKFLKIIGCDII